MSYIVLAINILLFIASVFSLVLIKKAFEIQREPSLTCEDLKDLKSAIEGLKDLDSAIDSLRRPNV